MGRSAGEGIGYPLQYSWASLVIQLVKKSACNEGELGSIPGLGRFPWRREKLPTPVFWPGEFHGLSSPWRHKESDTTEQLSLSLSSRNGVPLLGGHFLSISLGGFRVVLAPFLLSSYTAARNLTLGEIFTPSPSWRCGSPLEDAEDLEPNCLSYVNTPRLLLHSLSLASSTFGALLVTLVAHPPVLVPSCLAAYVTPVFWYQLDGAS